MASAKAMARIDWTSTFVAAPGLRPTAVEAPMPIRPTPTAAPRAAKPTCMLPLNSPNKGIADILFTFLLHSGRLPRLNTVQPPKFLLSRRRGGGAFLLMHAHEQGKHRSEQHKHQR